MPTSIATSTAMPARMSRGLSRNGRRTATGGACVGSLERRDLIGVTVAGIPVSGGPSIGDGYSRDKRKLRVPRHHAAIPRENEPCVVGSRLHTDADRVFGVCFKH